jgi:hypothetical protein
VSKSLDRKNLKKSLDGSRIPRYNVDIRSRGERDVEGVCGLQG